MEGGCGNKPVLVFGSLSTHSAVWEPTVSLGWTSRLAEKSSPPHPAPPVTVGPDLPVDREVGQGTVFECECTT